MDEYTYVKGIVPNTIPEERFSGTVNLYLVDLPAGTATFLATVSRDYMLRTNGEFVIWSELGCSAPERGATYVFERSTGTLRRLNVGVRGRLLQNGLFAGIVTTPRWYGILFDLATLERIAVWSEVSPLEDSANGRYWSPYLHVAGTPYCGV